MSFVSTPFTHRLGPHNCSPAIRGSVLSSLPHNLACPVFSRFLSYVMRVPRGVPQLRHGRARRRAHSAEIRDVLRAARSRRRALRGTPLRERGCERKFFQVSTKTLASNQTTTAHHESQLLNAHHGSRKCPFSNMQTCVPAQSLPTPRRS